MTNKKDEDGKSQDCFLKANWDGTTMVIGDTGNTLLRAVSPIVLSCEQVVTSHLTATTYEDHQRFKKKKKRQQTSMNTGHSLTKIIPYPFDDDALNKGMDESAIFEGNPKGNKRGNKEGVNLCVAVGNLDSATIGRTTGWWDNENGPVQYTQDTLV